MIKINENLVGEWFEGQWIISGDVNHVTAYIQVLVAEGIAEATGANSFKLVAKYLETQNKVAGFARANGSDALADRVLTMPPMCQELGGLTLRDLALSLVSLWATNQEVVGLDLIRWSVQNSPVGLKLDGGEVTPVELLAEIDRLVPTLVL